MPDDPVVSIGTVAARTGLAVSAIRFYESEGLITAHRTPAGHRRFPRSTIRRVSFILVCQRLGYPLDDIRAQLATLPEGRTPNDADWERLSAAFRSDIDQRMEQLATLRQHLDGCIGCGCLSLEKCLLYNPDDAAASLGSGPRYLLGDTSADLPANPTPATESVTPMTHDAADWHLAQINIGRLHHPTDDPRTADFMNALDEINALAEASPGFIWRLQDESGNATGIRAFEDETILPNLSVWESAEALKDYVFKTDHARFLRRRGEWFERMEDLPVLTMWWVPAGHTPTLDEAKERIDHLVENGPTETAFAFHPLFGPPGSNGN